MSLSLRIALAAVTGGLIALVWPLQSEVGYIMLGVVGLVNGIFWGFL